MPPKTQKVYLNTRQVQDYLVSVTHGRNANMLERQAKMLGVSLESLAAFQARYDDEKAVVVFPMVDAIRRPIGCRFRRSDGRKWSLKGGREGVFVAQGFDPQWPVFITEGPTDAATLWEVGFRNVLGRPSCMSGGSIIESMMRGHRYTPVIIVADPDDPGRNGATDLANLLRNPVIVINGPMDLRDCLLKVKQSSKLTKPLSACIVEAVSNDEPDGWHTVYRNQAGRFNDFRKAIA